MEVIRPGESLRYIKRPKVGGNIRNRLIIISCDHFNDFEDFEEDGQLDLLVVYFPLKMYIFLFDLEIFASIGNFVFLLTKYSIYISISFKHLKRTPYTLELSSAGKISNKS